MTTLAKPRYGSVLKPQQQGVAPWATCRNCDGPIRQHRNGSRLPVWRHIPTGARTCTTGEA